MLCTRIYKLEYFTLFRYFVDEKPSKRGLKFVLCTAGQNQSP